MTFNKSNVIVSGSRSSLNEYANYTTVFPKPVMVGDKIVLTQDMINKQNVKYIIKWNFDLDDETITVPEGCLIEFDGGSFSNGTLVGNETILVYNQEEEDVFKNVSLEGSFERSTSAIADKMDNTNGMAKIYLKKNKPLATQLTQPNTIYVIQYDFILGEDITIPENCILEFDGGSISGEHTLTGNNTKVVAPQNSKIFHTIDISGTWNVPTVYVDWFDVSEVVGFDNTPIIINAFNLTNDNVQNTIVFPNKTLYISSHVTLSPDPEHLYLFKINSNTNVIINSHLKLNVTDKHHYQIFITDGNKNINITGSGSITGDLDEHEVVENQQYGYGIVPSGENITISNITISKCIGDGIYINDDNFAYTKNIKITNVTVDTNRRNGITLEICDDVEISYCTIKNTGTIKGDNPKLGIDFEPFSYVHQLQGRVFNNFYIHNNTFSGNVNGDIGFQGDAMNMGDVINNVVFENNIYTNENGGIIYITGCKNVNINNEHIARLVFAKHYTVPVNTVRVSNCYIHSVTTENLDTDGVKNVDFYNCKFKYLSSYAAILTNGINTSRNFYRLWNNINFYNCDFDLITDSQSENSITLSDAKLNSDENFYNCRFVASRYSIINFFGIGTFDSCYFNCRRITGTLYKADNKSIIRNCTFDTKEENIIFRIYGNSDVTLNQGSTVDVYNNISLKHNGGQIIYIDSTSASYTQNCKFRFFGNKDLGYGEFNPSVLYEGSLSMDIESFGNKKLNGKPSHPVIGDTSFENGIPIWWNGTAWVDATGTPV